MKEWNRFGLVAIVMFFTAVGFGVVAIKSLREEKGDTQIARLEEFKTDKGTKCVALVQPQGRALALSCDFTDTTFPAAPAAVAQ